MKREKTVIDVEVSEEKQREIVSSLLREHTNVGMKFERERTRQEEMVRTAHLVSCSIITRHYTSNCVLEKVAPPARCKSCNWQLFNVKIAAEKFATTTKREL